MSKSFYPTIGLEIHAELKTSTKMFCACKNDPDETSPNTNICPVCTAQPGALPVPNKKAIEHVVKVGLAMGGEIADFTEFDRKNYFYPDIPKGYQISQYKYPIVSGGELAGFLLTRIHLEEDTGTNKHDRGDYSLVDFNRAGVPLMELVTEPMTFTTNEEASKAASSFAKEFQLALLYLGVSEANMEKGEMRVEANISISPEKGKFGTKVEVKNLNSFRSAERAIMFELNRMQKLYETIRESEIVQETRGWDDAKQSTFSQRSKENANDYRYFPEPDIPKFRLSEIFNIEALRTALPELPTVKRERYRKDFGIKDEDIESYVNNQELGEYFEKVAEILQNKENIILASNFISNDIIGSTKVVSEFIEPELLAETIIMISNHELSSRAAKDIILVANGFQKGQKIREYAIEKNLLQKNNEAELKETIQKIIDSNPTVIAEYKAGKIASLQFLIGQAMKESKGSANPATAKKLLIELIK